MWIGWSIPPRRRAGGPRGRATSSSVISLRGALRSSESPARNRPTCGRCHVLCLFGITPGEKNHKPLQRTPDTKLSPWSGKTNLPLLIHRPSTTKGDAIRVPPAYTSAHLSPGRVIPLALWCAMPAAQKEKRYVHISHTRAQAHRLCRFVTLTTRTAGLMKQILKICKCVAGESKNHHVL